MFCHTSSVADAVDVCRSTKINKQFSAIEEEKTISRCFCFRFIKEKRKRKIDGMKMSLMSGR